MPTLITPALLREMSQQLGYTPRPAAIKAFLAEKGCLTDPERVRSARKRLKQLLPAPEQLPKQLVQSLPHQPDRHQLAVLLAAHIVSHPGEKYLSACMAFLRQQYPPLFLPFAPRRVAFRCKPEDQPGLMALRRFTDLERTDLIRFILRAAMLFNVARGLDLDTAMARAIAAKPAYLLTHIAWIGRLTLAPQPQLAPASRPMGTIWLNLGLSDFLIWQALCRSLARVAPELPAYLALRFAMRMVIDAVAVNAIPLRLIANRYAGFGYFAICQALEQTGAGIDLPT